MALGRDPLTIVSQGARLTITAFLLWVPFMSPCVLENFPLPEECARLLSGLMVSKPGHIVWLLPIKLPGDSLCRLPGSRLRVGTIT